MVGLPGLVTAWRFRLIQSCQRSLLVMRSSFSKLNMASGVSPARSLGAKFVFALFCLTAIPLLLFLTSDRGKAQPAPPRLQFEVASIKPTPKTTHSGKLEYLPGRISVENRSVVSLLEVAYRLFAWQIERAPEWADSERWDIEAKAIGNPSRAQLTGMLIALMGERFNIRSHMETKILPIYTLTASRGGIKLQKIHEENCTIPLPDPDSPPSAVTVPAQQVAANICGNGRGSLSDGNLRWHEPNISMGNLARALTDALERPVVDKTGFEGTFNMDIEFAAAGIPAMSDMRLHGGDGVNPGEFTSDPSDFGLSIFVVLNKQFGLKLESTRGPAQVLVIDSISRPTPN